MLQVPDHIARANIATQDVKFAWDEWRTKYSSPEAGDRLRLTAQVDV